MKKFFKRIKNFAKRCWEAIKSGAKKAGEAIVTAAEWCLDHSEIIMGACGVAEAGMWAYKKFFKKTATEKETDYQRTHIWDPSLGHHWTLKHEMTTNQMMEYQRRKDEGEAVGDILSSMKVLA